MDWLLFERPTCDTFSKQRRFAAIVVTSGRLPGRGGLFERNAVPLNEVEEFFGRSRRDRVGVLAARAADRLDAELPQHVHRRASVRADGVRERNHAAKVRLCDFADIVLDHQGFPDHLHVDRLAIPSGRLAVLGQRRKVKVQPVEWLPQDVFVLDRESLLSGIEPALNVLTSVSDVDRNLRPRHNALFRRIP